MELAKGLQTKGGNVRTNVLQLPKNFYSQKQAGLVWNYHLNDTLKLFCFKPSDVENCVRYQDNTIFLCYVDN